MATPSDETLRLQLTELNIRSRWYVAQLWQMPFAYIGIAGVTIGTLVDKDYVFLGIASIALAIAGMLITGYYFAVLKDEDRAVKRLQKTEAALGIKAEDRASNRKYDVALMAALVILTTLFLLVLGIIFITKK
jgi:hypothetical protein